MSRTIAISLLMIGAVSGIVIAAAGLVSRPDSLAPGVVARVNQTPIRGGQLQHYATLINANSRTPKDRRYVLQRMIDEELLVQRGVELGLVELNSTVRNTIVQAVSRRFASVDNTAPIDPDELRRFYELRRDYFTPEDQYRVEVVSPNDFPLPDKPVTRKTLIDYLGNHVAGRVFSLAEGESTGPVDVDDERFEIRLIEKMPGVTPPLDNIRPLVEREFRRYQSGQAFDEYVRWLRERADITIAEDFR